MIIWDRKRDKDGKLIARQNFRAILEDGQIVKNEDIITYNGDECLVHLKPTICFLETLKESNE